jgi:hypothetical protein
MCAYDQKPNVSHPNLEAPKGHSEAHTAVNFQLMLRISLKTKSIDLGSW